MRIKFLFQCVFPVMGSVVFAGCLSVGPDYTRPDLEPLEAWHARFSERVRTGEAEIQTWWLKFDDPVLNDLIKQVHAANLDLRMAAARIAEARALRGIAFGDFFPAISGSGDATRSRSSEDFRAPGAEAVDWTHAVGVGAGWELDAWGRVRRVVEAADAGVEASIEDYRDLLVILYAETATGYLDLRALQARIGFAVKNAELQRQSLRLTRDRLEAELVPELDVKQAQLALGVTEAQIPSLRAAYSRTLNRLAVLTGNTAGEVEKLLQGKKPLPSLPAQLLVGTPADVLRQRPDVRRAERQLASQTARVGVATAELLPRLSLSGTFAFEGFSDILDYRRKSWSFGPSFRWRLFEGGRIRSQIKAEDARVEQALARYEKAVLSAYEDFETAVDAFLQEKVRCAALKNAMTAAEDALEMVLELYRAGLTDFQNVLDMQRELTRQQDAYAQSSGQVGVNLVQIYRAMGGGAGTVPAEEGQ